MFYIDLKHALTVRDYFKILPVIHLSQFPRFDSLMQFFNMTQVIAAFPSQA
jgi:hypothetical protein